MASTPSIGRLATDPLRNFKFRVNIAHPYFPTDFMKMGFMSVSGLNITTEVIPYREGGMNTTTQKMPGQSDFAPITLSRGLILGEGVSGITGNASSSGSAMNNWMRQLFTVQQGTGTRASGETDFRADITISVLDHPVTTGPEVVKAQFKVYHAWPTAIAFSDFDAGANAIVVQQMTLAHEGFEVAVASSYAPSSVARV